LDGWKKEEEEDDDDAYGENCQLLVHSRSQNFLVAQFQMFLFLLILIAI
jgi:hypothetical protein